MESIQTTFKNIIYRVHAAQRKEKLVLNDDEKEFYKQIPQNVRKYNTNCLVLK